MQAPGYLHNKVVLYQLWIHFNIRSTFLSLWDREGRPLSGSIKNGPPQQTRDIDSKLLECWSTVWNDGPTLTQHRINGSCLLGSAENGKLDRSGNQVEKSECGKPSGCPAVGSEYIGCCINEILSPSTVLIVSQQQRRWASNRPASGRRLELGWAIIN